MVAAEKVTIDERVAFVLIDGIGDNSACNGDTTPLAFAATPNLNALVAQHGCVGAMDPVAPGLACGSDTAHLSLLGYEPRRFYRGRGAFESAGAGLAMRRGDVAFKSNFATVDDASGLVVRRRCDRQFEKWGPPLCAFLSDTKLPSFPHVEVAVRYATEHRCGVRLRGAALTDNISGTDPLKDGLPLRVCKPTVADDDAATRMSAIVNELSAAFRRRLATHPLNVERIASGLPAANVVLLRGAGACLDAPSFADMHGMRAFMVAPTAIIGGLGLSLGITRVPCVGATGDYHSNLNAKADMVARLLTYTSTFTSDTGATTTCDTGAALKTRDVRARRRESDAKDDDVENIDASDGAFDDAVASFEDSCTSTDGGDDGDGAPFQFAFLHVKGIDDAGHDKNADLKVRQLEKADIMVGRLVAKLNAHTRATDACRLCNAAMPPLDVASAAIKQTVEGAPTQLTKSLTSTSTSQSPPTEAALPAAVTSLTRYSVVVTGDHSTPVRTGDHSCEPVPVVIAQLPLAVCDACAHTHNLAKRSPLKALAAFDSVTEFNEIAAIDGVLGRFCGRELMPLIKRLLARSHESGETE
jgi:2,3-diphosphopglycerate-independent phosphoglycerate mutase